MDGSLFKSITELPFIFEGAFNDGSTLKQNKTCSKKCKSKDCLKLLSNNSYRAEYICSYKYNNILLVFNNKRFILNGLILNDNKVIPTSLIDVRTDYTISRERIEKIISKLYETEKYVATNISSNIEKNFGVFHDIKTSLGLVQNCAESYISELSGNDFMDKLNNADENISDLYESLKFVNSQLGMIDVMVNVESITYGNKNTINIFRLFHKLNKLFSYKARKRGISIRWNDNGNQIPDSIAYPTLEFVPIILLDNAVKYSFDNTTINVDFQLANNEISVAVSSYGKIVEAAERSKIFEKYYRGKNVTNTSAPGIGMGLWLVKEILKHHQGEIMYIPSEEHSGVGVNNFQFIIRIA